MGAAEANTSVVTSAKVFAVEDRSTDAVTQGASQAVLGLFYHLYSTKNGSSLNQAGGWEVQLKPNGSRSRAC